MRPATLGRGAVVFVVLLGALGMVTWRQSRALESLAMLDELHRQMSVAAAEQVELEREITRLQSRARVVPAARERLGMHIPEGVELVTLRGDSRP
jgi:cell division protein FtsL